MFKLIAFLCRCVSGDCTVFVCEIVFLCVSAGSFYFPPLALNSFFFEQAADSSLDYYLDLHSFTEHHLSLVLSVLYSSFSGILFSLLVLHNHLT